ncbi:baseplate J/gp47 family protein [Pseudomonas sp. B21-040]|uniref:baseplate J/gp47 family protein n=1 Tax=unclassified Pseudomonas TaxID=196821 RepID=UPI001CBDAB44|nr:MULTISPECIES: baseplate J/gp47 family protein [unclassified Pseudomonas]UVL42504.1 baseplate J/gp47 family protein [Pseudomonas sp. B21-040]UVL42553.1 baseplate J/gp47 family protein [Pseudomonas sp. B21-040]
MPFARPTLTELIERVITDISSRVTGVDSAVLRRSLLGIVGQSEAGAVHMLYGYLDWIAKQSIIDTAEKEYLERWAAIWKVTRKTAGFASGQVALAGTAGAVVVNGTILQRQDGVQYKTQGDAVFSSGPLIIPALAVEAGEAGNFDAGLPIFLLSPIAGVQSTGTTATKLENGVDVETDERLLARLLARIQQPPHGGASFDYEQWALEVAGVTRVWVYPIQMGPGTVTVLFVCDEEVSIIPSPAKVAEVQAYIDARAPVTAEVFVAAPVADPLNMNIKLTPNTTVVQSAVRAELADLIDRDSAPGGTIFISRLREAVSLAAGESNNQIVSPTADVAHAAGHMATLGTPTFSSL